MTQKGTVEAGVYRRAKILLLKSEGISNEAIADKLDITVPTVRLCLDKFSDSGVLNIACQKPSTFGLSAELWYPVSLTKYVNSVAEKEGFPRMANASVFSIRKILWEAMVNPHKVTYYCEERDPDFDKKMHDVLVIYKQLELRFDETGKFVPFAAGEEVVHTISYDEKAGIQAIKTTGKDKAPFLIRKKYQPSCVIMSINVLERYLF